MKVFIAGGTGVLGKRLVPQLVDMGNEVGVLSRSDDNERLIEKMDAKPISTSLFDKQDLIDKTEEYDVFVHIATSIPRKTKTTPEDWQLNNRLRLMGTENLIAAALNANCDLHIQQSATFGYGHHDNELLDETDSLELPVPTAVDIDPGFQRVLDSIVEMEDIVDTANDERDLPSIILRFGWFYSHDSVVIEDLVEGNYAKVFRTDPHISIINVDDAVKAIITAIKNYKNNTGKVFNVVDDSDTTWREFVDYAADVADIRKPMVVPAFLVKLLFNAYALNFMKTSTRVDNSKVKQELGWEPDNSTYEEGLEIEIAKYKSD